jgi:predicted phage terminase large subunit-like protein
LIENYKNVRRIRYPAIAEKNEPYRKKGEPLFPAHKSLEFLLARKNGMTKASWESLYQQNPIIVGGGVFPIEEFKLVQGRPARQEIRKTVRYWDKAGTEDGGAYTCGTLLHDMKDGRIWISDVRRGQWSAREREMRIRQTAEIDRADFGIVETWVEQEPGSGGKESAERTIANLRGFIIKADRVTGDKETRAEPYAAQVQGGNVYLTIAPWNRDFLDEHEHFPTGRYKDQIDSAAGAFAKATVRLHGSYDTSLSWVGGMDTSGKRND